MIKRIVLVVFIGLLYNPFSCFSQDSIPAAEDLKEVNELKFQQFFFKALSEKSIKNYQRAIENLEACNEILPQNLTVFFEFSKNYLLLNKPQEAKEYIQRAIQQEPENIWMLEHLVAIHKKEQDYKSAIKVQKKIITLNSKKSEPLVYLYLQDRDYTNALSLMSTLEEEKGLSKSLKRLKQSLEARKGIVAKKEVKTDLESLVKAFDNDRTSFSSLKKLLEVAMNSNPSTFHKYSELAVELFPAQPYAYLMRGKSLNTQNNYQDSIDILLSGIDFVIDDTKLEADFYENIANAYEGLKKPEKALEYRNKVKKLKNIK
jgi:tetratricopeptide (TPR) repeat protein